MGIHRWAAVFVGFFGTLLVIRPGFSTLTIGIFSALGAGVTQAFFMLLTRKFAQTTDLLAMIFHTNFWSMLFLTPLVILYWDAGTTLHHITLMMLVGLISMCAHFFIIEAYASAPAPVIAPIVYWEMVPATLVGYALYHKIPDFWTFVGVGILSLSACYIAYREHLHRKQRIS